MPDSLGNMMDGLYVASRGAEETFTAPQEDAPAPRPSSTPEQIHENRMTRLYVSLGVVGAAALVITLEAVGLGSFRS